MMVLGPQYADSMESWILFEGMTYTMSCSEILGPGSDGMNWSTLDIDLISRWNSLILWPFRRMRTQCSYTVTPPARR